jgi:hypothetical protein
MKIKPTHGKTPARFPANPEYKPLKTIFTPPRATWYKNGTRYKIKR